MTVSFSQILRAACLTVAIQADYAHCLRIGLPVKRNEAFIGYSEPSGAASC